MKGYPKKLPYQTSSTLVSCYNNAVAMAKVSNFQLCYHALPLINFGFILLMSTSVALPKVDMCMHAG